MPALKNQNPGKTTMQTNSAIVSGLDSEPGASNMKTDINARKAEPTPAKIQTTVNTIQSVLF